MPKRKYNVFFYFGRIFVLYLLVKYFEMKFLRYFAIAALAVSAMAAVSCKKDKENTETKEYLNGTLSIEVPAYLK